MPTDTDLAAFLRARLPPYQIPVLYAVVEDVPRTASMKPVIPEVAKMLEATRARRALAAP